MTNFLRVDRENCLLIMDKTFAKNASLVGSREYAILQSACKDYPNYAVKQRKIKTSPTKEHYNGLTYKFMEEYIDTHENAAQIRAEYEHLREIARCHSIRYAHIKKWFLEKYPDIAEFGKGQSKSEDFANAENKTLLVIDSAA